MSGRVDRRAPVLLAPPLQPSAHTTPRHRRSSRPVGIVGEEKQKMGKEDDSESSKDREKEREAYKEGWTRGTLQFAAVSTTLTYHSFFSSEGREEKNEAVGR